IKKEMCVMAKIRDNLVIKLLLSIVIGLVIGLVVNENIIGIIQSIQHILGQFIFFCVPLVIIAFIAPSFSGLKHNAGKMLISALVIAYLSSVGAALFATISGYVIIPGLNIASNVANLKELPEMIFKLDIPPIMS